MGIILERPFPTFPEGFPKDMMDRFTKESGFGYLGNYPASGTEIIKRLGQEHLTTGKLIVYTSSDSVFQIAAHEKRVPLNELYRACEVARSICDDVGISRVIARPFVSEGGNFVRTTNRKDFSMKPPQKTALDFLLEAGVKTIGIGKIDDIFAGVGLSRTLHSKGNPACIEDTIRVMKEEQNAFIFSNLVDFDMLYGHRRDPQGYYSCLKEFDDALPNIVSAMNEKDVLIISADHGNDPCLRGTDHTREYVPMMIFHKGIVEGKSLGTGSSFANIGKTILVYFGVDAPIFGTSYLKQLDL